MRPRTVNQIGCSVTLDTEEQVIAVDVKELQSFWDGRGDTANNATKEGELFSSLSQIQSPEFTSAATLLMKAKQFDDGLYAAVELLTQEGTSEFLGKKRLLEKLASTLTDPATEEASAVSTSIFAAMSLGNPAFAIPERFQQAVVNRINEFKNNEFISKPLSFYTWTAELSSIFQQDRMLQEKLSAAGSKQLIDSLKNDPVLKAAYCAILSLTSKLTNPFAHASLTEFIVSEKQNYPKREVAFLPSSVSPETDLMRKLYGHEAIPEGFSLIEEVINRLKNGTLNFQPKPESGWYDYSLWAIEPLVRIEGLSESVKLSFSEKYKGCLLDLFRGAYCLTRETHVKQLESLACGAMPAPKIYISPECTVEPLPSVYLRRAFSYKFIANVLTDALGEHALARANRLMKSGSATISLLDELIQLQSIFYGAHVVACHELGLEPFTGGQFSDQNVDSAAQYFKNWANNLYADSDMARDARCMVPVFFDIPRQMTKVWVFLGWRKERLELSYKVPPKVAAIDSSRFETLAHLRDRWGPDFTPDVRFSSQTVDAAYPVVAEIYVRRILDREEFAAHCDRFRTENAILDGLKPDRQP